MSLVNITGFFYLQSGTYLLLYLLRKHILGHYVQENL